jgi:AcrR family transcriptional regulator
MSQPDTKERIIDAAEMLFALKGFHGTSLRGITTEAGVNLAAVNYHFGSKQALIEAIFERRLQPLNRERFARLAAVKEKAVQEGRQPAPDDILRAFVEPTLFFRQSSPGARHFVTLVGRFFIDEDKAFRTIFLRQIGPLLQLVHGMLCEALPTIDREVLLWRLHFVLGALSHVMLLGGRLQMGDQELMPCGNASHCADILLPFLSAGMEAPCP